MSHKLFTALGTVLVTVSLAACDTSPTRQQIGTGTGAVVGGAAGNVITGGSTLGTIGGAAAGGVIGHEVTKPD